MSRDRFRRKKHRQTSEAETAVTYRDRASYAMDAQLASLASAGDDAAFTALVTRFQPAVFRWALTFARDPDEAEDITQEVFVRTHRQLGDYRSDGPLEAWLYAITRRAALQLTRKGKRRARLAMKEKTAVEDLSGFQIFRRMSCSLLLMLSDHVLICLG